MQEKNFENSEVNLVATLRLLNRHIYEKLFMVSTVVPRNVFRFLLRIQSKYN